MVIFLIILTIVLVLSLGTGAAIWFAFQHRLVAISKEPAKETTAVTPLTFRWRYIILPIAILLLSVVLVIFFYRQLPAEVAHHFGPDGSPDAWLDRWIIILWTLLPQFLLTLLAAAVTWGTAKLGTMFKQTAATEIMLERIIPLMGNMIALPQIILCFAMLDIFSYNSYQIRIIPLWLFALVIMGLGAIILGIFFMRALRQSGEHPNNTTPQ